MLSKAAVLYNDSVFRSATSLGGIHATGKKGSALAALPTLRRRSRLDFDERRYDDVEHPSRDDIDFVRTHKQKEDAISPKKQRFIRPAWDTTFKPIVLKRMPTTKKRKT